MPNGVEQATCCSDGFGNAAKHRVASVRFNHGLGDCANFAHMIPLWISRGWNVHVACRPDKAPLFLAAGAKLTNSALATHNWPHAPKLGKPRLGDDYSGNKAAWNLGRPPMPEIGKYDSLWDEYLQVKLDMEGQVTGELRQTVLGFLDELRRPIIAVHTHGNTLSENKSLGDSLCKGLYAALIDRLDGTLLLLDWDNRVPRVQSARICHLTDDWKKINILELYALLKQVDLLIGIDSGPLHFCRFTDTAALGLWTKHYPGHFYVPRANTLNLVKEGRAATKYRRLAYNLVEYRRLTGGIIALHAERVLQYGARSALFWHLVERTRTKR